MKKSTAWLCLNIKKTFPYLLWAVRNWSVVYTGITNAGTRLSTEFCVGLLWFYLYLHAYADLIPLVVFDIKRRRKVRLVNIKVPAVYCLVTRTAKSKIFKQLPNADIWRCICLMQQRKCSPDVLLLSRVSRNVRVVASYLSIGRGGGGGSSSSS